MCHLIRQRLDEGIHPLSGHVEADETYVGGKAKNMHAKKRREKFKGDKGGRGTVAKTPVFGVVERGGRKANAIVVPDTKAKTLLAWIQRIVKLGSYISTDEWAAYNKLDELGYTRGVVKHSQGEYMTEADDGKGGVIAYGTNTMEGFWGIIKRAIHGVFHHVSDKYLQNYLSEYLFRYNHRRDETPMFRLFMVRLLRPLVLPVSPVPLLPSLKEPTPSQEPP